MASKREPLWQEFTVWTPPKWFDPKVHDTDMTVPICGLCGCSGRLDQPVPGWDAHLKGFCICPNGRKLRQQSLRAERKDLKAEEEADD